MAITITDSGQFIKVVNGTKIDYLNKLGLSITSNGDTVFLERSNRGALSFLYTDVGTPSEASAVDLAEALNEFI